MASKAAEEGNASVIPQHLLLRFCSAWWGGKGRGTDLI